MAKSSKADARYTPKGSKAEHCSICRHFNPDSTTCARVAGSISPNGWSRFFSKKS